MRLKTRLIGAVGFLLLASAASRASAAQYFDTPDTIDGNQEWTNYLRLADLDGDGDLDLLVPNCSGFFSNPGPQSFRIYRNDAGALTDQTAAVLGSAQSLAVRVVAVGDVDGDGALDIFAPSASGAADKLWINDGSGSFTDEAATRLPGGGTSSHSAGVRFGDVDGDGDLDLLVALGYATADTPVAALYINDGTGNFAAGAGIPNMGPGQDPDDVDFIDFDRDFDLDVLITTHSGSSILWRNDAGVFTDVSGQLPGPAPNSGPFKYGPSVCDVDGDGDLDIWVDNVGGASKLEQLLINDGAGNFTDETTQRVAGNVDQDDNGVMCVDVDDDGDFDAIVTNLGSNERVLINDGSGNFTYNPGDPGFPTSGDCSLWADYGDLDGDGRLEAVTGQGECGNTANKIYPGSNAQPVDATPPTIVAVETVDVPNAGEDLVIRYAVSDRFVSDAGPRLASAFANVSVDGTDGPPVDAIFMGGDLFRVVIPGQADGAMVELEVCAEDRQNNLGCSQTLSYIVGDPSSGVGGGGGTGGAGTGGTGASSETGGSGGTSGGNGEAEEGGCGCTAPRQDSGSRGALLLACVGLGLALRRRRTRSSR